jgi:hypothetical protein
MRMLGKPNSLDGMHHCVELQCLAPLSARQEGNQCQLGHNVPSRAKPTRAIFVSLENVLTIEPIERGTRVIMRDGKSFLVAERCEVVMQPIELPPKSSER